MQLQLPARKQMKKSRLIFNAEKIFFLTVEV